MRTLHRNTTAVAYRSGLRTMVLACSAVLLVAAACKELTSLEQDAPSRVLARDVVAPANAQLLVTSAISDYECALAQYIVATGLVGDELIDAQLAQVGWDYDRRTIAPSMTTYAGATCTSGQVPALYTPIQVARFQADVILTALEGWTDTEVANRTDLIGQAAAHAGYSLTLLGEGMCSAAINGGPEVTRAQVFAEAEARFDKAIAAATTANNASILNMARVGRARVRLNQNKTAEARADAILVTSGFVRNGSYSGPPAPNRRQNLVNTQQFIGLYAAVDSSFRNLTFAGVADPRVAVVDAGVVGQDRVTRIWRTSKYPTAASPIPIASYDEAQLIVAEVDAGTGTPAGIASAVTIINDLHTRAGIPVYAGGTAAEVQAQVREERRRELFLEGQRFNDIIRFNVTLSPAAGQPFPIKGGVYGSERGNQACFPLPDLEKNNNPNF
jgi:starch-binding outer membrane protein, SusD/RagB family